jgi:hypothetical protein
MPDFSVREPMVEFSLAAAELSITETFTARRSRWDVESRGESWGHSVGDREECRVE